MVSKTPKQIAECCGIDLEEVITYIWKFNLPIKVRGKSLADSLFETNHFLSENTEGEWRVTERDQENFSPLKKL